MGVWIIRCWVAAENGKVGGLQILNDVKATWLDDLPQIIERRHLLLHSVASIVDGHVEASAPLVDELLQEDRVCLVASQDGRPSRLISPYFGTCCVILHIVEVNARKILKPGVIRLARAVVLQQVTA